MPTVPLVVDHVLPVPAHVLPMLRLDLAALAVAPLHSDDGTLLASHEAPFATAAASDLPGGIEGTNVLRTL